MKQPDEIIYYELPPTFATDMILPMYSLTDGIAQVIPQMTLKEEFDEANVKLKARLSAADPESSFKMTEHECLVMCQMMGVIKFYHHYIVVAGMEGMENPSQEQLNTREMFDEVIEQIQELSDAIFEVFPSIKEPFYFDENNRKKQKDEAKTLGLDKTVVATQISIASPAMSHYMANLFAFFDFFIMLGVSDFSERVREADFCCITEVNEVREIFKKAVKATKRKATYATSLTLRDIVVLLMLNNLFQKTTFSDAGDELENIFEETAIRGEGKATAKDMRNHMLKLAKILEDHLYNAAIDIDGFEKAIRPIFNFPV